MRGLRQKLIVVAAAVLAAGASTSARAEGDRCARSNHPPDFVIQGTFYHITLNLNIGNDPIGFQFMKMPDKEVVGFAQIERKSDKLTFYALINWDYCKETLLVEALPGKFKVARKNLSVKPAEKLLYSGSHNFVPLVIPIGHSAEGSSITPTPPPPDSSPVKTTSPGPSTIAPGAIKEAVGDGALPDRERKAPPVGVPARDSTKDVPAGSPTQDTAPSKGGWLKERIDGYGSRLRRLASLSQGDVEKNLESIIVDLDQADALLGDEERTAGQYAAMVEVLSQIIDFSRTKRGLVPLYWLDRLAELSSDAKFANLPTQRQARLVRAMSNAAAMLASHKDDPILARQLAKSLLRPERTELLIAELAKDPGYLNEAWLLTKESAIAASKIEPTQVGAIALYAKFFDTAQIDNPKIAPELRRRIAVESAIYGGQYFERLAGQLVVVDWLDYATTSSSQGEPKVILLDPPGPNIRYLPTMPRLNAVGPVKTKVYTSLNSYSHWLERNDKYFVGGKTYESLILTAYKAKAENGSLVTTCCVNVIPSTYFGIGSASTLPKP